MSQADFLADFASVALCSSPLSATSAAKLSAEGAHGDNTILNSVILANAKKQRRPNAQTGKKRAAGEKHHKPQSGGATHNRSRDVNVNRKHDVNVNENHNVNVNKNVDVNRNVNRNVNVHRSGVVIVDRSPGWRGAYWGTLAFGVTLGALIVVAANTPPPPPDPTLCWTWSNSELTEGYWYYCAKD
ncbi:MAG: hypothetical protein AAGD47_03980 [Pseudomonadota bacterium]